LDITNEVQKQEGAGSGANSFVSGSVFPAQLKSIAISNFMGVQGFFS
jgi:hypothetical protein